MSDLDKLIEAVERGDWGSDERMTALGDISPVEARAAYLGSLNAAKALHEVLLPGWIFDVTNNSAFVMREIPDSDLTDDYLPQYLGENDSPARAWLLAILRAYAAQQVTT